MNILHPFSRYLSIFLILGLSDIPAQKPIVVCPEYIGRNREIELSPFWMLDDLVPFSVKSYISSEKVHFEVSGWADPKKPIMGARFELYLGGQEKIFVEPKVLIEKFGEKYIYKFSVKREQVEGAYFVFTYKKPFLVNLVDWLPPEEFFMASLKLVDNEVESGSELNVEFTYSSLVPVDLEFGSTCKVLYDIFDKEGNKVMVHPLACGDMYTKDMIQPGVLKTRRAAIKTERWDLVGKAAASGGKLKPGRYKIVGYMFEYRKFGMADSTWVEIK